MTRQELTSKKDGFYCSTTCQLIRACRVLDSFLVWSVESGGVDGLYVAHQLKHTVS